jgi:hypothetical protein
MSVYFTLDIMATMILFSMFFLENIENKIDDIH